MDSIEVTYELRRFDTAHFHGWIVWEIYDGVEDVYFSSPSFEEARDVFKDLTAA